MKKSVISLFLLTTLSIPAFAGDGAEARHEALAQMGELNGVALACRYFDQTKRIKRALIEGLPKQRKLGQAFDDQTNESFIAFVKSGRSCPSPALFSEDVDRAIEALERAYTGAE